MEKIYLENLPQEELENIRGGIDIIGGLAILVGYGCWAIDFCYNLGKD